MERERATLYQKHKFLNEEGKEEDQMQVIKIFRSYVVCYLKVKGKIHKCPCVQQDCADKNKGIGAAGNGIPLLVPSFPTLNTHSRLIMERTWFKITCMNFCYGCA